MVVWGLVKRLFIKEKKAEKAMPKALTAEQIERAKVAFLEAVNNGVNELFEASSPYGFWKNSWYGIQKYGEVYLRINARRHYVQIATVNINPRYQGKGFLKGVVSMMTIKNDRSMEPMFNLIKLENIHNEQCVCQFVDNYAPQWTVIRRELHGVRNIYLVRKGHEGEYDASTFSH